MNRGFNFDELTVLELYESDSREECLKHLRGMLSELEGDQEMTEIVISVIEKLDDMSDKDYLEIEYYDATDDAEDTAEDEIDSYDMYSDAFIDGAERLRFPVDYMWDSPGDDWMLAGADV